MLSNATNSVNKIPIGISLHPTKPNFVDAWRHAYDWSWFAVSGLETLGRLVTRSVWSPIHWKTDKREGCGFVHADFGALDCDGTYPLEQACKDWCDTNSIIVTTKSDTPQSRRYRIIFPWSQRITNIDLFMYNQSLLVERYNFDIQCTDGARLYWPGKDVVQIVSDGEPQPIQPLPEDYSRIEEKDAATMARYAAMSDAGVFPHKVGIWLKGYEVEGERNTSCYLTGKYLTFWGMDPEKIIALVLKSQLPLQSYKSLREAEDAVRNGIRKAKKIQEVQAYKS